MPVLSLIYHDVREASDRYTVSPDRFRSHLDAIEASGRRPGLVGADADLLLTFDDGAASALETVAPLLEDRGWRGHFFVTTGDLGKEGFLDADGVRALRRAGHLVGSHSHTHPYMTKLADAEIAEEWRRSKEILEDVLGEPVESLSVPTGFYSARVGRPAAALGYRTLFTSEPWVEPRQLDGALVFGRFSIVADTPASHVAALCRLERGTLWRERASWETRKVAKRALGPLWFPVREAILARRS